MDQKNHRDLVCRDWRMGQASCSFHLRQLAKYGFVEDAGPGEDRRERRWRVTDRRSSGVADGDPVVTREFSQVVVRRESDRILEYLDRRESEPEQWREGSGESVHFEAPFIFLLFGNRRALLLDTGATADPQRLPLRSAVDGLIDAWLAEHPREDYELIAAHTHGHHDHVAGDTQFADRPNTTIVGSDLDAVRTFFGLHTWPDETVSLDLGGRVLEIVGSPGHHPSAITVYDPWTGILFTGDTVLPARL